MIYVIIWTDKVYSAQYLGQNLEELRGRTILDDDSCISLPLLTKQSLLFPEQTLPMTVFGPQVDMLKTCIQNNHTFGVISYTRPKQKQIGTTAEIYEYIDSSDEENEDRRMFCLKAKGRQRFRILHVDTEVSFYIYFGCKCIKLMSRHILLLSCTFNSCCM